MRIKGVKNKLKASCQDLQHGVVQLTDCFLECIKGWQTHHPLWESHSTGRLPGDIRNTCSSVLRCGLSEKPLNGNIWTHGCWDGYIQA